MEKTTLPNSVAALILGIVSIVTCFCYGGPGLVSGIIALVLANKAIRVHGEDPERYTGLGNAKAGKIMGLIGVILGSIYLVIIIGLFITLGTLDPESLQDFLQDQGY